MPTPATQNAAILAYLRTNGSIDPMTALHMMGVYRLAARIFDLRRAGHDIEKRQTRNPNRTTYHLRRPPATTRAASRCGQLALAL